MEMELLVDEPKVETEPSLEEDHLIILPPVKRVRKKRVESQLVTFEKCPLFPRLLHKLLKVGKY
jgi:hypothetical protein